MKKNNPFGEVGLSFSKKNPTNHAYSYYSHDSWNLQARATDAYSQKTRLSLNFSEAELIKVLDKIEEESEFFFLYNEKLLDTERKVSITEKSIN